MKLRRWYIQNYEQVWYRWWRFRRFYCNRKLPGSKRWVTRVMRREFGITKDSFTKDLP